MRDRLRPAWALRFFPTEPGTSDQTMNEIDLPCSDCGTDLVECAVEVQNLPISTDYRGTVTVAACPTCDARYYPHETLSRLTSGSNRTHRPGES